MRFSSFSSRTKGICYVILSSFGFAMMAACVRLAGTRLPSFEKAFFRNLIGFFVAGSNLLIHRISPLPDKKENIPPLLFRSIVGTVSICCNYYAIDRLVLADASMLNKVSPFAAILFSSVYLKEKPTSVQLGAVLIAFLGCTLIVKPGFRDAPLLPALLAVSSGICAGMGMTFVRKLGMNGENSMRIIFFFSAFSCLAMIPLAAPHYVPILPRELIALLFAGCFGLVGQYGLTRGYACAPAKEISIYDYSQIIFAALLGFFLFDQIPDWLSIIGYLVIFAAGALTYFYNRRTLKKH